MTHLAPVLGADGHVGAGAAGLLGPEGVSDPAGHVAVEVGAACRARAVTAIMAQDET